MSDFPLEALATFLDAWKGKDWVKALEPGFKVAMWLVGLLAKSGLMKNDEGSGVLRTETMPEVDSIRLLEQMVAQHGAGQQPMMDPATLSKLLQFFIYYVLPRMLNGVKGR